MSKLADKDAAAVQWLLLAQRFDARVVVPWVILTEVLQGRRKAACEHTLSRLVIEPHAEGDFTGPSTSRARDSGYCRQPRVNAARASTKRAPEDRAEVTGRGHQMMTPEELADLAHLRRARDLMDRDYAQPLTVAALATVALMSPAHFARSFRAAYGETPYTYLMTRRIERAKAFLRQGRTVTDTCFAVGCTSLGSFSSRFTEIVGETPSQYRGRDHRGFEDVPSCVSSFVTRPRRAG